MALATCPLCGKSFNTINTPNCPRCKKKIIKANVVVQGIPTFGTTDDEGVNWDFIEQNLLECLSIGSQKNQFRGLGKKDVQLMLKDIAAAMGLRIINMKSCMPIFYANLLIYRMLPIDIVLITRCKDKLRRERIYEQAYGIAKSQAMSFGEPTLEIFSTLYAHGITTYFASLEPNKIESLGMPYDAAHLPECVAITFFAFTIKCFEDLSLTIDSRSQTQRDIRHFMVAVSNYAQIIRNVMGRLYATCIPLNSGSLDGDMFADFSAYLAVCQSHKRVCSDS